MAHEHFNSNSNKHASTGIENDLLASGGNFFPAAHQTEGNQSIANKLHQVDSDTPSKSKVGVMIQELNHKNHNHLQQQDTEEGGINFVPMTVSDEEQELLEEADEKEESERQMIRRVNFKFTDHQKLFDQWFDAKVKRLGVKET